MKHLGFVMHDKFLVSNFRKNITKEKLRPGLHLCPFPKGHYSSADKLSKNHYLCRNTMLCNATKLDKLYHVPLCKFWTCKLKVPYGSLNITTDLFQDLKEKNIQNSRNI